VPDAQCADHHLVNKVDRAGVRILDEVADALALDVSPQSWPVGMAAV
jgi:peptide chain release factor 3